MTEISKADSKAITGVASDNIVDVGTCDSNEDDKDFFYLSFNDNGCGIADLSNDPSESVEDLLKRWTTPFLQFLGLKRRTGVSNQDEGFFEDLVNPLAFPTLALTLYSMCGGFSRQLSSEFHSKLSRQVADENLTYYYMLAGTLPSYMSILLAIWTDVVPGRKGMRRKPYMYWGVLFFVLGNGLLFLFSGLRNGTDMTIMIVSAFVMEIGAILQFVAANAIIVERCRLTNNWAGGARLLVATTFMWYVGEFIGSLFNAFLLLNMSFGYRPIVNSVFSLLFLVPFLPHLVDPCVNTSFTGLRALAETSLDCLQRTSFWLPIFFIFGISSIDVALFSNLQFLTELDNQGYSLNFMPYIQCVLFGIGVVLYAVFLTNKSWHTILRLYTGIMVGLTIAYLIIRPNALFAAVAFAANYTFEPFQNLPFRIVILTLCPQGAEATFLVILASVRSALAVFAGGTLFNLLQATFGRYEHPRRVPVILCVMMAMAVYTVIYMFPRNIEERVEEMEREEKEEDKLAAAEEAEDQAAAYPGPILESSKEESTSGNGVV